MVQVKVKLAFPSSIEDKSSFKSVITSGTGGSVSSPGPVSPLLPVARSSPFK